MAGRVEALQMATLLALGLSPGCLLSTVAVDQDASESGDGRPNLLPQDAESDAGDGDGDGDGDAESATGEDAGDGEGDVCASTARCPEGEFCWADYSMGGGDAPGDEEFACHPACVVANDPDSMIDGAESYWCKDDASCCVAGSSCDEMGYCNSPPGDGDGDGDGDAGGEEWGEEGPIP